MKYKFTGEGIINLESTDELTNDKRWLLLSPWQMSKKYPSLSWKWFYDVLSRENEITSLALGHDKFINRPVLAKTVNYRIDDMENAESINERRKILLEQVKILNELSSFLLPEALDWFTVENILDPLKDENSRKTEPVLILDYIPGKSLKYAINTGKYKNKKGKEIQKVTLEGESNDIRNTVNIPKIGRISLNILTFLKLLCDKEYCHIALSPDHIIVLKDDTTPRFVGLGRICKTINGVIDLNHINSGRTVPGYSAPELNDYVTGRRENVKSKNVAAYSLGVLMHQMAIGKTDFEPEMLVGPAFVYPNPISEPLINNKGKFGKLLHNLIANLCNHDENKRLTDFDEIEKQLLILSSMYISGEEGNIKEFKKISGEIKSFYQNSQFGEILGDDGRTYKFNQASLNNLNSNDLKYIAIGNRVTFDGTIKPSLHGQSTSRAYANNLCNIKPKINKETTKNTDVRKGQYDTNVLKKEKTPNNSTTADDMINKCAALLQKLKHLKK